MVSWCLAAAVVVTAAGGVHRSGAALSGTTMNGSDSWSVATLSAPDPLTCAWSGLNSLTLAWTNTSGTLAGGYSYERSNSSGSGYAVLGTTTGASSTTATDPNPSPPTLRYYRVTTTQALWTSPYTTVTVSNTCAKTISSIFMAGTVSGPLGVAVDASGNVYTSDTNGARVVKTTPAGVTTTFAGTGTAGFAGDGGTATAAKLSLPLGLAFDSAGNLYIADHDNLRIRKITTGGIISTIAGTGASGYTGDGGPATSATMTDPTALAFDSSDNLYIAEAGNNAIRKVTTAGTMSTFAGTGVAGYTGDGGPATAAKLAGPYGIVFDSANTAYITDTGNSVLRKVTAGTISTVAGGGGSTACTFTGAATSVSFNGPRRLAYDPATGRVFIADRFNHCIRAYTAGTITQVAGTGTAGYSGDNGPAVAATVNEPAGLAYTGGNLYITEVANNVTRKIVQP